MPAPSFCHCICQFDGLSNNDLINMRCNLSGFFLHYDQVWFSEKLELNQKFQNLFVIYSQFFYFIRVPKVSRLWIFTSHNFKNVKIINTLYYPPGSLQAERTQGGSTLPVHVGMYSSQPVMVGQPIHCL